MGKVTGISSVLEPLLTVDDAATLLGQTHWTLRHYVKTGRMRGVRIGRRLMIERSEIRRLVEGGRTGGCANGGTPMKYRKKPVVVEAIQFDGTPAGAVRVFNHFDIPQAKFCPSPDLTTGTISIPTSEGVMRTDAGDWIIRGVKGEFYACNPEVFAATYEAV